MPRIIRTSTNFSKGELSPKAIMRSDTRAYADAVREATNMRLLAHGGAARRPGTRFLADISGSNVVRFETFSFGPNQAYLMVFYPSGCQVYLTDGTLADTVTGQPWTEEMLGTLGVTQSGNVMIIVHPDLRPRKITRVSATEFVGADFDFGFGGTGTNPPSLQPFHKFENTKGITMQPSAYTGAGININFSSIQLDLSEYVGSILRYAGTEILVTSQTDADTLVGTCRETLSKAYSYPVVDSTGFLIGQLVRSTAGDAQGVVIGKPDGTHVQVLMMDRAQAFEYEELILRYLVSGTTTSKLTGDGAVVSTPPATEFWDEQAFSDRRGYPVSVAFHEQRLIFGGSRDLPNRLWASVASDFTSFDLGLGEDNAAISVEIATDQVSQIRHMMSHRHLAIFTDGGEFYVPQGDSQPLTPSTISIRRQTRYGSSWVRPVAFDGSSIFVQLSGRSIREFIYTDLETAYSSHPLSVMSSHLIKNPIDMDAQVAGDENEEQYIYVVNQDGTMAVFHGLKKEELAGWTPWTTDGFFERVRVVDGFVFVAVARVIDGVERLYLERVDPSLTLDCSLVLAQQTYDPSMPWLKGEMVDVVYGNAYRGEFEVSALGGLPADYEFVYGDADAPIFRKNTAFGLDYPVTIKTLPLTEVGGQDVSLVPKRILRAAISIYESVTINVNGFDLTVYNAGDEIGLPPASKTGVYEFRLLGWTKEASITIQQQYPLHLTVLGIHLEVSF